MTEAKCPLKVFLCHIMPVGYAHADRDPVRGLYARLTKGVVWEVYKSLPTLLEACCECLSDNPLFVVITVYAVHASAIHVAQALDEMIRGFWGKVESGELVTRKQSAGRLLSQAVYARWER